MTLCRHCDRVVNVKGQICWECLEEVGSDDEHRAALKIRRERSKARAEKKRKNGICNQCSLPVKPGYRTCEKHYQKIRRDHAPDGKETKRLQKRTDDGLCISCPKPLDGKGRKCSSCRKRETTLVQERDRKGICHNCANPALPGRTQCAEHVAKQEISNHEAYIKRKASGKCVLCSKGPAVEGKTRCQPCFDKYAAKSTKCLVEQVCYGCGTSSDNGCLHCDDCLEARRQASLTPSAQEALNKRLSQQLVEKGLPASSLSIFEAFDLKHDYIRSILNKMNLPTQNALYIDSEIVRRRDGNEASNVHEWTAFTYLDGKPQWFSLRADPAQSVKDDVLKDFATSVKQWLDTGDDPEGKTVVMYGISRPENHRLVSLGKHLGGEGLAFKSYEPQGQLLSKIFTRDRKLEHDPCAPVYVSDWRLSYISSHLNRSDPKGDSYCSWRWPVTHRDADFDGKSVWDVAQLFNLLHALRHIRDGGKFKKTGAALPGKNPGKIDTYFKIASKQPSIASAAVSTSSGVRSPSLAPQPIPIASSPQSNNGSPTASNAPSSSSSVIGTKQVPRPATANATLSASKSVPSFFLPGYVASLPSFKKVKTSSSPTVSGKVKPRSGPAKKKAKAGPTSKSGSITSFFPTAALAQAQGAACPGSGTQPLSILTPASPARSAKKRKRVITIDSDDENQ